MGLRLRGDDALLHQVVLEVHAKLDALGLQLVHGLLDVVHAQGDALDALAVSSQILREADGVVGGRRGGHLHAAAARQRHLQLHMLVIKRPVELDPEQVVEIPHGLGRVIGHDAHANQLALHGLAPSKRLGCGTRLFARPDVPSS